MNNRIKSLESDYKRVFFNYKQMKLTEAENYVRLLRWQTLILQFEQIESSLEEIVENAYRYQELYLTEPAMRQSLHLFDSVRVPDLKYEQLIREIFYEVELPQISWFQRLFGKKLNINSILKENRDNRRLCFLQPLYNLLSSMSFNPNFDFYVQSLGRHDIEILTISINIVYDHSAKHFENLEQLRQVYIEEKSTARNALS